MAEGAHGRMPNLDLVNTALRASQAERVTLHLHESPQPMPAVVKALGATTPVGGHLQRALQPLVPNWPAYLHAATTLWTTMWHQASGHGLGGHAPALGYRIESITLQAVPSTGRESEATIVNVLR